MTEWPRCEHCGERMCCDGKGNYECVCDAALKESLAEPGPTGMYVALNGVITRVHISPDNMMTYGVVNDMTTFDCVNSYHVALPIPIQVGDVITFDEALHVIIVTRFDEVILTMAMG